MSTTHHPVAHVHLLQRVGWWFLYFISLADKQTVLLVSARVRVLGSNWQASNKRKQTTTQTKPASIGSHHAAPALASVGG